MICGDTYLYKSIISYGLDTIRDRQGYRLAMPLAVAGTMALAACSTLSL